MTELISKLKQQVKEKKYLSFTDEEFKHLDSNLVVDRIRKEFSGKHLFRLPEWEIEFFEWVKLNDPEVWSDIWNDQCCADDEIYTVSIDLLQVILDKERPGFPICDLQSTDNYYFCPEHLVDEESKIIVDVAQKLLLKNKKLTIPQLLALEISINPIDIWHFAYRHKKTLTQAKDAVDELVEDGALIHLREFEHLVPFIRL